MSEAVKELNKIVTPELFKPICINEGFINHTDECWNDSLSMILLFADTFKEITQPQMYFYKPNEFKKKLLERVINNNATAENKIKTEKAVEIIIQYLDFLSKRFKNHYEYVHFPKPITEQQYERKRRMSAVCGRSTALLGKYFTSPNNYTENYLTKYLKKISELNNDKNQEEHGNDILKTVNLSENILGSLNVPYETDNDKFNKDVSVGGLLSLIPAYLIQIPKKKSIDEDMYTLTIYSKKKYLLPTPESPTGHMISVFKCNNEWFLYDDNNLQINTIDTDVISQFSSYKSPCILEKQTIQIKENDIPYNDTIIVCDCPTVEVTIYIPYLHNFINIKIQQVCREGVLSPSFKIDKSYNDILKDIKYNEVLILNDTFFYNMLESKGGKRLHIQKPKRLRIKQNISKKYKTHKTIIKKRMTRKSRG